MSEPTMSCDLSNKKCVPCAGGVSKLAGTAIDALMAQLGNGWRVVSGDRLEKDYKFKDFRTALAFTNRVGELAEEQGHHPDIHLGWGRVKLELQTHKVGGLTESDFILAAKADKVL